jgi:alkylation response protein AidB-like acyl-CoA dehydrogenase
MAADDSRTADAVAALFAPEPAVAAHPAVRAVRRIARDVLVPHAPAADDPARGVDPAHLDLLAEAGQLAVTVPAEEGGLGGDVRVGIETVERLSGACGATWFVVTQHQMPQAVARGTLGLGDRWTAGPAVERHRAGLSSGRTRAGIAMAHLRRPGPPAVRAEPDGAGWRLSGTSDWCTGWGLIDVVMIAGTAPDDRVVLALVPARDAPGLRSGAPLRLSVMGGTRTVPLTMDGFEVPPDDVLAVVDGPAWRAADDARTANAMPAAVGLLRRIVVALAALGEKHGRPEAVHTALHLGSHGAALRARAYGLLLDVPAGERTTERIALRGELAALTVRAAHALVAARSGSAMLADSPEQRWAREAAFHLVQAQTTAVRAAQLTAFAR